jgi:hypothetical protein
MTVSTAGDAFLVGQTFSTVLSIPRPFPTTSGAFQAGNFADVFVVKMDASGQLIYGAIVGGPSGAGDDNPVGIALDLAGNAIVAGNTNDPDFPTTPGVFDRSFELGKFFIFKLNAFGSDLLYSTLLGSNSFVNAVTADAVGNAYVTGTTGPAYPTTPGSFGSPDGQVFVTKLNPTGTSLVYSGRFCDCLPQTLDLEVGPSGKLYMAGLTDRQIPTTPDALKATRAGEMFFDGYLVEISPDGSSIPYSTLVGGSGIDFVSGLAVDGLGRIHLSGPTQGGIPTTPGAFSETINSTNPGTQDAFYLRLNGQTHAVEVGTYLGGSDHEDDLDVAVSKSGQVYLAGRTQSSDFPLSPGALQPIKPGGINAVFVQLNNHANTLLYSTYLGGDGMEDNVHIATDGAGGVYVAGTTDSVNFPATPNAFQLDSAGANDVFLVRFDDQDALSVSSISPTSGGDIGRVTIGVNGSGLALGTSFRLARAGEDITPLSIRPHSDGGVLTATLDLTGKALGVYDVVVSRPDGQSVTLPNAFTIEPLRPPDLQVELICPAGLRPGVPDQCVAEVANLGNVDANWVPLTLTASDGGIRLSSDSLQHPPIDPAATPQQWDEIPDAFDLPNALERRLLILPTVPAGGNRQVQFEVQAVGGGLSIRAATLPTFIELAQQALLFAAAWQPCVGAMSPFLEDQVPAGECMEIVQDLAAQIGNDLLQLSLDPRINPDLPLELTELLSQLAHGTLQRELPSCVTGPQPINGIQLLATGIRQYLGALETIAACQQAVVSTSERFVVIPTVVAIDPNDKSGPTGLGPQGFISRGTGLGYSIRFENLASATGPAKEVVITDQLDPAVMDLSAVTLFFIQVGNLITKPLAGSPFSTDIFLSDLNLIARASFELNNATGLLTMRFQSIDPATNEPTTDPLAGFLPPNTTPPQGQGSIFFTVGQKPTLADGTFISNQASIVFDSNAPILTSEWFNTIDSAKPVSQMNPLAPVQNEPTFLISWQGSDTGSGVQTFSIHVSDNGGPFTLLQGNLQGTSLAFTGVPGHTYGFYSIAEDAVGNVEDPKAVAEAVTQIRSDQTITFEPLADKSAGDPPFAVNATASSGLTVVFTATGNCTVSANIVTLTGPGTCTITASQPGEGGWNAAPEVSHTFNIGKSSQTITFDALLNKVFGDDPFQVNATASSALPVSFSALGNCTILGSTVTLTAAGSCTITASQAGDANYNAAPDVSRAFNIARAAQTITLDPIPDKASGDPPFAAAATASSGLPVTFGAAGSCTVAGNIITLTGSGSCTITASQAGDANYNAAPDVIITFNIGKLSQTITFGPLADKALGDPPFALSATASSGLTVLFSAAGNCTIAGNIVTLTGAGSCTITARQPGDATYNAAPDVLQTFNIGKQSQTITFGALADKAAGDPPFVVNASASSGLPVSFSASGNCSVAGNIVTLTAAGSCTITASQAGDATYNAAPDVARTFGIGRQSQTITFGPLADKTAGDLPFAVTATASSGLAVTFAAAGNCTVAGNVVTLTGAGTCTITASQAGDATYNAAPDVARIFNIVKRGQTITFGPLADKALGDPPFAVNATASSGLAVTFTATGGCTVAGNIVTLVAAGTCTITASQPGDATYNAAADVLRSFGIGKLSQTITFGPLPGKTLGDPPFAVNATASSGLPVSFTAGGNCTVAGNVVTMTGAGSCTITAHQPGDATYNAAPDVLQTFSIGGIVPVDTLGPVTSAVKPTPPFVAVKKSVVLTAQVSDAGTGGSNVAAAEYRIDNGSFKPMQAADGNFSSASENVKATIAAFSHGGVHDVCVRGRDAGSNVGPVSCMLLAVYDPDGGLVVGGGWIQSPAGALVGQPAVTGKLEFILGARYERRRTVPTGEIRIDFDEANLKFRTTAFEWLVVDGGRTQMKGIGTLNGVGGYQFLVTALGGKLFSANRKDAIRIKITDPAGVLVYDNQPGAPDSGNAATDLDGGLIVVRN